jgi:hypothetical protein
MMKQFGNTPRDAFRYSLLLAIVLYLLFLTFYTIGRAIGWAPENTSFDSAHDHLRLIGVLFFLILVPLLMTSTKRVEIRGDQLTIVSWGKEIATYSLVEIRGLSAHLAAPQYRIEMEDGRVIPLPTMADFKVKKLKAYLEKQKAGTGPRE